MGKRRRNEITGMTEEQRIAASIKRKEVEDARRKEEEKKVAEMIAKLMLENAKKRFDSQVGR